MRVLHVFVALAFAGLAAKIYMVRHIGAPGSGYCFVNYGEQRRNDDDHSERRNLSPGR